MNKHRRLYRAAWWIALSLPVQGLALSVVSVHASESRQPTEDQVQVDVTKICESVVAGNFGTGAERLTKALVEDPTNPGLQRLDGWFKEWNELEDRRGKLRKRLLDTYVSIAEEAIEGEKWLRAADAAREALTLVEDAAAIRDKDWFKAIASEVEETAQDRSNKEEWFEAYRYYSVLDRMYVEGESAYRSLADHSQAKARLVVVYNPENDWKKMVRDVGDDLVAEAFRHVQDNYQRAPDFSKITQAGIKALILLGDTPQLRKTFSSLEDETKRREYVDQLTDLLNRNKDREISGFHPATDVFQEARRINRNTVDVDERVVTFEYLRAAMDSLDKFSSIIWPSEKVDFQKLTEGEFSGVGIQIRKDDASRYLFVVTPLDGTPAYQAGIEPGDLIVAVEEQSTENLSLNEAVSQITGKKGTQVKLTIRRRNAASQWIEKVIPLTRDDIQINTIKGLTRPETGHGWNYMVDPVQKIAYVRVTNFMKRTVEDLDEALDWLLDKERMNALILDLRSNPGGVMAAALQMSDRFLEHGEIVSTYREREGERPRPTTNNANRSKTLPDFPMVVLLNDQSASASEIVAGALQGNARADIVGQRSFGKASVQNVYPMALETCFLKLTTAHYMVPSGGGRRDIHRHQDSTEWGVEPDVALPVMTMEEAKVIRLNREREIIQSSGLEQEGWTLVVEDETAADEKDEKNDGANDAQAEDKTAQSDAAVESDAVSPQEDEEGADLAIRLQKIYDSVPAVDPQLEAALFVLRAKLLADSDPQDVLANRVQPEPEAATQ
jgi:carboxyl-terminal processing protease